MQAANRNDGKRGFTLIELLVVVAIIALLISLLLPSLNRAKQQARQLQCSTNLRAMGEASNFYAADNSGFVPRGIQKKYRADGGWAYSDEYHIFATAILGYLGWSGDQEYEWTSDTTKLWTTLGSRNRGRLNKAFRKVPQFQCPDFPIQNQGDFQDQGGESPLDYVASAMPIPYQWGNIEADNSADLEWDPENSYQGESAATMGYEQATQLDRISSAGNPAELIYVTEAHFSLPWNVEGPRFHHFFLASQLPLGGLPRVANDQRHPNGLNALFFDGHVQTMDHHSIDAAWPNPLSFRLRWFTVMPEGYVE